MPSSLVGRQRHGYLALGVGAAKRESGASRGAKRDDGIDGLESRRRLMFSKELAEEERLDLVGGGEWGKMMDTSGDEKISGFT